MHKELNNILEQFPEHRAKILALFSSSEDFKSLCDDYWQCKNSLQKFRENKLEDSRVEEEYVRLCIELEDDALRYLEREK